MTLRLALYQPDIPQNTGTILRMAACLGLGVDIIGPAGFDFSDRGFKRAGLDYLEHVGVERHQSFMAFEAWRGFSGRRLILATTGADQCHTDFRFLGDDILLMGRESAGVPEDVHDSADFRIKIPVRDGLRSLNLAVATAIVAGEALRQVDGFPPLQKS